MIRGTRPMDLEALKSVFDEKLKPIMDHPALLRVQLLDEPEAGAFGRYKQVADALKAYAPNLPPFCCLSRRWQVRGVFEGNGQLAGRV